MTSKLSNLGERYGIYWLLLRKNKLAMFAIGVTLVFAFVAFFPSLIASKNPYEIGAVPLEPPSWKFPFGTDNLGRCLFSRICYGARPSLYAGVICVGIGLVFGTMLGLISGYYGGKLDSIIMGVTDILLALPFLLLAIVIVTFLGPSLNAAIMGVGVWMIPQYIRLARAQSLQIKQSDYVTAAKMTGESGMNVIFRYILPNGLSVITVQSVVYLARAILFTSGLSFLGLGAQPPSPEWGAIASDARSHMLFSPHFILFPSLAIFIIAISFNVLGDTLRDILDPQQRTRLLFQ